MDINVEKSAFKNLEKGLETILKGKCKEMAIKCANLLTEEYERVIDTFYEEYKPKYYKRHNPGGYYSTNKLYYTNPGGTVFYGGVRITSEDMPEHKQSNESVLDSFLEGFHGPEFAGIKGIKACKHMMDYRDFLYLYIDDLK